MRKLFSKKLVAMFALICMLATISPSVLTYANSQVYQMYSRTDGAKIDVYDYQIQSLASEYANPDEVVTVYSKADGAAIKIWSYEIAKYQNDYATGRQKITMYSKDDGATIVVWAYEASSVAGNYTGKPQVVNMYSRVDGTKITVYEYQVRTLNNDYANADEIVTVYSRVDGAAISIWSYEIAKYQNGYATGRQTVTMYSKNDGSQVNVWAYEIAGIRNNYTNGEIRNVHYSWSYNGYSWDYDLNIPVDAYKTYKSIPRSRIGINYSYYVTNSADDDYLARLANVFKEKAEEKGFSKWEMVHLVVRFVQNLQYVSDKVSTGYDEYPKFPLETLMDKGGDCEDTAILLASLLRELGYGTALLVFDNHMAVGVKGADGLPGYYFEYYGVKYYYIETTNSGWDAGEMPPEIENKRARILPL